MERITAKMLDTKVAQLNDVLGTPPTSYSKQDGGRYRANVGNYHIDACYGGFRLCRMANTGGGVEDITDRGTRRDVYGNIAAVLAVHWIQEREANRNV